MSIRQTRLEYTGQRIRGPKLSVEAFMAKVKRLMARRMVSDGVVDRKVKPSRTWSFYFEDGEEYGQGTVDANTRSEARAAIKNLLGAKSLPKNIIIENANSTRSVGAA